MNEFKLKKYKINSDKIKEEKVRLHFLSDLHGLSFGVHNEELMNVIKKRKPDLVLLGGDMIVSAYRETWDLALEFIKELKEEFPVAYAMGNHELKAPDFVEKYGQELLANETKEYMIGGNQLRVSGLALEREYFKKPFSPKLTLSKLRSYLGHDAREDAYEILLAHNPCYGDTYFAYGADLTLSGHYHGGVVRFGENTGLVSTNFRPFPRYCCGRFQQQDKNMIVSAGLGEHTISLRIHNPRELIEIDLLPLYK